MSPRQAIATLAWMVVAFHARTVLAADAVALEDVSIEGEPGVWQAAGTVVVSPSRAPEALGESGEKGLAKKLRKSLRASGGTVVAFDEGEEALRGMGLQGRAAAERILQDPTLRQTLAKALDAGAFLVPSVLRCETVERGERHTGSLADPLETILRSECRVSLEIVTADGRWLLRAEAKGIAEGATVTNSRVARLALRELLDRVLPTRHR